MIEKKKQEKNNNKKQKKKILSSSPLPSVRTRWKHPFVEAASRYQNFIAAPYRLFLLLFPFSCSCTDARRRGWGKRNDEKRKRNHRRFL